MSEVGDIYKEYKKERQEKKNRNADYSMALLKERGIPFVVCNAANHHLLVADRFDFWPSTGKWKERGKEHYEHGVSRLLCAVKEGE